MRPRRNRSPRRKLAELGVPEADPAQAKTRWRKLELPPARQTVKLVPADDPVAAGKELARPCSAKKRR